MEGKMKKIIMIALLLMLSATAVFAAEEVDITIAENDIYINGQYIDNTSEAYPFIRYNLITYVPMTWDMTYALGLKVDWDLEKGLRINKRNETQFYEQRTFGTYAKGKKYKAIILDAPIKVNGKEIDNSQEKYPVLRFNNIMYFPMTWRFMVDEFNSGYRWNEETGLRITADASLKKVYRAPVKETFSIDLEELRDNGIYMNPYIKMEVLPSGGYMLGFFYDNKLLNNRSMNAFVDYYDLHGDYLLTEVHKAGVLYKYNGEQYSSGSELYARGDISRLDVRLEYNNKEILMDQLKDAQGDVKIEVISRENFSKASFGNAEYFVTQAHKCTDLNMLVDLDLAKYSAFFYPAIGLNEDQPITIAFKEKNDGSYLAVEADFPVVFEKIQAYDEFRLREDREYLELEKVMNGRAVNSDGDIIYLYDQNKELIKILLIEELLVY